MRLVVLSVVVSVVSCVCVFVSVYMSLRHHISIILPDRRMVTM